MMKKQYDIRQEILHRIGQNGNGEGMINPEALAREFNVPTAEILDALQLLEAQGLVRFARSPRHIFIGHGRSSAWKELKDFLSEKLHLQWDEFDREPGAGRAVTERLKEMLDRATFAFLVMTAEDEHADGTKHARENVIHEIGLFQGKLGFRRAIVLLEEGCEEFTNLRGLIQLRFPSNNIRNKWEDIRDVLRREGIL